MTDWLTDNYLKLLAVIRDIGEDGCETGAIDAPKLRLAVQDRRQIVQKLKNNGEHTQAQIAEIIGVSEATVSDDLQKLNQPVETRRATEAERKELFERPIPQLPDGLYHGDFRELSPQVIDDESVDLVFTDPPYGRDAAVLYEHAAKEAARILKPGGSMVCYCGHLILPQVLPRMMSYLKYFWIGANIHDGGTMARMREYGVIVGFKPLLWFVKKYRADKQGLIADTVLTPKEKDVHAWQQSIVTAEHFIGGLTSDGGLVVDFFAGGGTTLIAAKNLGRKCVAFEVDENAAAAIAQRLAA